MDLKYQIIDSVPASIYWKDKDGLYLGCNNYMAQMAGAKIREDIIGKSDHELPWSKEAPNIRSTDLFVMNSGKSYEAEETTVVDGATRVFLSSKSPLWDDNNNILGIIGVSIDITQRKQLEREFSKTEKSLIESFEVKKKFLRNISHEVRNPLQAFVSTADTLLYAWDKISDELKKKSLINIVSSANRLSELVLNTFDLSDFISGDAKLNLRKYNVTEEFSQIVTEYNNKYCAQTNRKIVFCSLVENLSISFDLEKISRVLNNILMNALKFSPKGSDIEVKIFSTTIRNSTVPAIQCSVTDKGVGVPEDELEIIFEPFTESRATAQKTGGIGLGLAICKEIIEAHAGIIWAENNHHSGASVNFLIPFYL